MTQITAQEALRRARGGKLPEPPPPPPEPKPKTAMVCRYNFGQYYYRKRWGLGWTNNVHRGHKYADQEAHKIAEKVNGFVVHSDH